MLRKLIIILVVGIIMSGCTPADLKLDIADSGRSVSLAKGGELTITLEANPTTGYIWQTVETDDTLLQAVGEPSFQASSSALGAGGLQTFRYRALKRGKTLLKMVYHRPWEKDKEPIKTFTVRVSVI